MAGNLIELTDAAFQETVNSDKPTLIDFWAPWCGPCRMLTPTVEALAEELGDRANICKMNTDEQPETPGSLGVSAIPTVVLFKSGQEVERFVGVQPKEAFQQAIEKHSSDAEGVEA